MGVEMRPIRLLKQVVEADYIGGLLRPLFLFCFSLQAAVHNSEDFSLIDPVRENIYTENSYVCYGPA
jgi:hypothetical protein